MKRSYIPFPCICLFKLVRSSKGKQKPASRCILASPVHGEVRCKSMLGRVLGWCNEITPKCRAHMSLVSRAPSSRPCLNTSMRSVSVYIYSRLVFNSIIFWDSDTAHFMLNETHLCSVLNARMHYNVTRLPLYCFAKSKIIITTAQCPRTKLFRFIKLPNSTTYKRLFPNLQLTYHKFDKYYRYPNRKIRIVLQLSFKECRTIF